MYTHLKLLTVALICLLMISLCSCLLLSSTRPEKSYNYTINIDISGYVFDSSDSTTIIQAAEIFIRHKGGYEVGADVFYYYKKLTTMDSTGYYSFQGPFTFSTNTRISEYTFSSRFFGISVFAYKWLFSADYIRIRWTSEPQICNFYLDIGR